MQLKVFQVLLVLVVLRDSFCIMMFKVYLFLTEYVNPLTVVPASQVGFTGNSTTFQCHYRDGAQEDVTWQKKGGSLPSGRHSTDNGALTITDIDLQDEGTYVCKVNAGGKELSVEAILDVKCKYL